VLPVVARKRGLDGRYERVGGGDVPAKKREPVEEMIPPVRLFFCFASSSICLGFTLARLIIIFNLMQQPGTFGYDSSKYKPPQDGDASTNEFGHQRDVSIITLDRLKRLDSPPFSNYAPRPAMSPVPLERAEKVAPPRVPVTQGVDSGKEKIDEGAHGGGCCKCVIM
jgi:hypothetical protein